MAEESASPDVSAPRPGLRCRHYVTSVLGAGDSTRAMRRSPDRQRPWLAPSGAATAAISPSLLRDALASTGTPGVAVSVLDPDYQRRCLAAAMALALCGVCQSCGALGRPCWRCHSHNLGMSRRQPSCLGVRRSGPTTALTPCGDCQSCGGRPGAFEHSRGWEGTHVARRYGKEGGTLRDREANGKWGRRTTNTSKSSKAKVKAL